MQEAKLKERKKVRERKAEGRGEKEETVKVEKTEVVAEGRREEAEKEAESLKLPQIPSLKVEEFKGIRAKSLIFLIEKPKVERIEREISKVSIRAKEFNGVRANISFNFTLPKIRAKITEIKVPVLVPKQFHELKTREVAFKRELPEISVSQRKIFVPNVRVKKFLAIERKSDSLNSHVLLKKEVGREEQEEVREKTEGRAVTEKTAEASAEAEAVEEHEITDFFEFLLGEGASKISAGKPICVIVERTKEKIEEVVAVLCREIYRERKGGKPTPIYKRTVEELRREWDALVERKLIIVEEVSGKKEEIEMLREMLKGFFSQDMGFLILVSENPAELEDKIRGIEPSANIITVGLPPEIEHRRDEILRCIRGKKSGIEVGSFGEEFKRSVEMFDEELRKYLNYEKAPLELKRDWDRLMACSPESEKEASEEHSAMKAFVWLYEWKKHGKREIPELETEDRGTDVRIGDKNYEVETLFGVGDVISKLTSKIKKYSSGEKVYFVFRNLDILRNLKSLSSFKRDWEKAGYDVECFGFDFAAGELVPLEAFVRLKGGANIKDKDKREE